MRGGGGMKKRGKDKDTVGVKKEMSTQLIRRGGGGWDEEKGKNVRVENRDEQVKLTLRNEINKCM